MQGLAAVQATAEGDEDGCVGRPHSRPGWAGPPQRVVHFHQAPGPDPAHYHQDSCGANAAGVGGPHRGKREGGRGVGRGQGGRERGREPVGLAGGGGEREKRQRQQHKQERGRGRGGQSERNGEAGGETEGEGRRECPAGGWEGQTGGGGGG